MIRKFIMLLTMLFIANIAYAGQGSGKITVIYTHIGSGTTGAVFFNVENHTSPPACSSHEWAFSIDTEIGKAMYSLLLTAAAQNKSVVVQGTGDCAAWGDRERPQFILVQTQ